MNEVNIKESAPQSAKSKCGNRGHIIWAEDKRVSKVAVVPICKHPASLTTTVFSGYNCLVVVVVYFFTTSTLRSKEKGRYYASTYKYGYW